MKGHILIIDDNPMDVKILTASLEREGYGCFGFTDYLEGIEWLEKNVPTVILLDLQMPTISGYDLIPLIRQIPSGEKAPIVIISGKNEASDIYKALNLGSMDYVIKPIDPMVVQEKIGKLISVRSSEFSSVDIKSEDPLIGYLAEPMQFLSISEFGVKIQTSEKIEPGAIIEIAGAPLAVFGATHLILRCLSSEPNAKRDAFVEQMTFVGISEVERQAIRKSCRQFFVEAKNGPKPKDKNSPAGRRKTSDTEKVGLNHEEVANMRTILLVDDSPILRRVMERILSSRYKIVGHAGSGLEGFEKFKTLKPDLVLLDIVMPNCDGKDCLKMILTVSPEAKVVMVSSLGDEGTVSECLRLGACAFITKDKISSTDGIDSAIGQIVAGVLANTAHKVAA